MDWTQIIITMLTLLIGGGGIVTLVTLREKKTDLILQNMSKLLDSNSETNKEWRDIAAELSARCQEYKSELEKKDGKIEELYAEKDLLRQQLDDERTGRAVAQVLKCTKTGCTDRKPPFGEGFYLDSKRYGKNRNIETVSP